MSSMTETPAAPSLPGPEHAARVAALLAAGAAGDALGYTVEFDADAAVRARHGAEGLTTGEAALAVVGGEALPISDDTQMTLYVLDGLLEWIEWQNDGQAADPAACVWLACLRWWATQHGGALPDGAPPVPPRWLEDHPELRARRAPGNACLSGLDSAAMGLPGDPRNPDSKGCGTVMRSAPYGMVPGLEDVHVVSFARQGAVLTHGHPTAWVAAAAYSLMIAALLRGAGLEDAVAHARVWVDSLDPAEGGETAAALASAVELAASPADDAGRPGTLPAALGEGWVAEEALAIAVHAALVAQARHEDPADMLALALRIGANHAGDSDSTASLAGQLLGAAHGPAVFGADAAADGPAGLVPAWVAEREVVAEAARRWSAATT